MTREDFLSELSLELENVETSEVADVLQYYNEYFDDAQDEQKAIDELSSPKKIAEEILKTATLKSVVNGDIYTSFDGVRNIDVEVIACDVHFIRSDKNTVSYKLNNSEGLLACEVDKKTQTLVFKTKGGKMGNILSFGFRESFVDIYYKDSDFFENVTVKTISGDMDFEDILAKQIRLSSVSGDCQGQKMVAQSLFFETKSGDCNIDEIISNENNFVSLNSISGDIRVERFKADKAQIHTTSGDIHFENAMTKQFDAETISGDVFVAGELSGTNNLKSVSGDIHANSFLSQDSYNFNVSTVSGDATPIKGQFYSNKENSLNVKTVSGDITLNFRH